MGRIEGSSPRNPRHRRGRPTWLVPIAGRGPAEEAGLLEAFTWARSVKAKVVLAYVVEVPMNLPLDTPEVPGAGNTQAILEGAERLSHHAGVNAEVELLQARDAGEALVEIAKRIQPDLILMHLAFRPGPAQGLLGRTAETVLRRAPCEVWIRRPARTDAS